MVVSNNVVAEMLRANREEYIRAIQVAKVELADVTKRLELLQAKLKACELLLPDVEGKTGTPAGAKGIHAHIRPSDLLGVKTQREAWRKIAGLSGGVVRPTDAAQVLIDAKVTDKKYNILRSNALSWMFSSDEWERKEEGVYRWLEYEKPADGEGELWIEDQEPGEPYPTDNGNTSSHIYPANGETEAKVSE